MDFFFEQDRPERICRAPQGPRREYHSLNGIFGWSFLLREYADLPRHRPLPWALEHALSFGDPKPYVDDLNCRLPYQLSPTAEQADILRRSGRERTYAVGAPYFYMRALVNRWFPDLPAVSERRGTLVFTDKSTTQKELDFDRDRYAAELLALPEVYHPIYLSIAWRDFERGTHLPFLKAGLRVVSSGHSHDPLFLFRQHDLCRRFRYACVGKMSTSFCYAVLDGLRCFHLPVGPIRVRRDAADAVVFDEDPTHLLPGKRECLATCRFPPADDPTEQRALAERYAGLADFRTPEFLRNLWDEAEAALSAGPATGIHYRRSISRKHRSRPDEAAGLRTVGIDPNGWAACRSGWTIPAGSAEGLMMTFETAREVAAQPRPWTIVVDGNARYRCLPPIGRATLRVPARPDGQARTVEIRTTEDRLLPNGLARRAFRIHRLVPAPVEGSVPAVRPERPWFLPEAAWTPLPAAPPEVAALPLTTKTSAEPAAGKSAVPTWRELCEPWLEGAEKRPDPAAGLRRARVIEKPFPCFVLEDFLGPEWLEPLAASLPTLPQLLARKSLPPAKQGYVHGLDLLTRDEISPVWKELVAALTRPEFVHGMLHVFRPWTERIFPDLVARFGDPSRTAIVPRQYAVPGGGHLGVECQLAFHTPALRPDVTIRAPHLDRPNKLILLMMPIHTSEDDAFGGELELCIPRDEPALYDPKRRLPDAAVHCVRRIPRRNGLANAFLNGPTALHRIAPRTPHRLPQYYLDWVIEFPESLFEVACGEPESVPRVRKPWYRRWFSALTRRSVR